jgi:acetyl-CoA carboxylase alpha subunit
MFSGLSRLRVLSVLLPLVLVAPSLGGRLSDRAADAAASSQISGTLIDLHGVACPSPSTCVAVGGSGGGESGTVHGGCSSSHSRL